MNPRHLGASGLHPKGQIEMGPLVRVLRPTLQTMQLCSQELQHIPRLAGVVVNHTLWDLVQGTMAHLAAHFAERLEDGAMHHGDQTQLRMAAMGEAQGPLFWHQAH